MVNLYLNKTQEEFLKELLDHPALPEVDEDLLSQIKAKLNKKKIDTKAIIPELTLIDGKGKELKLYPREGNGAMMLVADKEGFRKEKGWSGSFYYFWTLSNKILLANYLHAYAIVAGEDAYQVYDKPYSEEFNVYKDEVERSITVSGGSLYFYTDDEDDDNWTYMTPSRVKEYLRILLCSIFLDEGFKENRHLLYPGLTEKYAVWFNTVRQA